MGIYGNATGGFGMPKTLVLVDENNNELTGVVVDDVVVFDATLNDIRAGKIAANAEGVVTGTKDIPAYRTTQGCQVIPVGSAFSISLAEYSQYDYTKLQCMIAPLNTDVYDSCAVDKIVLNDGVYMTQSTDKITDVTKNSETQSIDLNIVNDSSTVYFIYFFTYREDI